MLSDGGPEFDVKAEKTLKHQVVVLLSSHASPEFNTAVSYTDICMPWYITSEIPPNFKYLPTIFDCLKLLLQLTIQYNILWVLNPNNDLSCW